MVNPNELVDLDPKMEDILSVWGKDPTARNIERYFGAPESFRSEILTPESLKIKQSFLQLSKEFEGNVYYHQDSNVSQQTSRPDEDALHAGLRQSSQSIKGKSFSEGPFHSGGIEDIVNFGSSSGQRSERGLGRVSAVTRVSIAKGQGSPKGTGGRPEDEIGASPVLQSAPTGASLGSQVINQTPVEPFLDALGFSVPPSIEPGLSPLNPGPEEQDRNGLSKERREEDARNKKKGEKRKKQRPICSQDLEGNLVLGMDVTIEEALEVAECTLVGRARGKKFTSGFIKAWGEQNWPSDLIKGFEVSTLAKGWFMVRFENKEAADWVVGKNWALGNIPVLLKKWSPLFDAVHEKTDVFPVWVRAPGLPSFLWVESVFKAIGNRLGTFLEADMSFLETRNKAMARILVSLNPSRGLAEKINLQYKDYVFEQILDYEYLPFRCHRCHAYGHLAKECPLGRRRR